MSDFWYNEYILPSGTSVYLTSRPDRFSTQDVKNNFTCKVNKSITARFLFTDDYSENVGGCSCTSFWYPWFPLGEPAIECVWAYLNLMNRFDNVWFKEGIWLHCDSSTMRAPTMLGLYLDLRYPDQAKDIVANKIKSNARDTDPLYYLDVALERNPKIKELIDTWKKDGYATAYKFVLGLK